MTLTIIVVIAALAAVSAKPLVQGKSAGGALRVCAHQAVESRRNVALVIGDTLFLCRVDGGLEVGAHAQAAK